MGEENKKRLRLLRATEGKREREKRDFSLFGTTIYLPGGRDRLRLLIADITAVREWRTARYMPIWPRLGIRDWSRLSSSSSRWNAERDQKQRCNRLFLFLQQEQIS